jgi:hypothetical protein
MGIHRKTLSALYKLQESWWLIRRQVLCKILIEFRNPRKLVRLIKMSLTETYSRVPVGKIVSDRFCIRNGLKKGDAKNQCFLTSLDSTPLGGFS